MHVNLAKYPETSHSVFMVIRLVTVYSHVAFLL